MRATRAYVAGAGTAGSLVAGAAVLFVLASAIVAFNGWPQSSLPALPASVVAAPVSSPDSVVAATRVVLAAAATAPASGSGAPAAARPGSRLSASLLATLHSLPPVLNRVTPTLAVARVPTAHPPASVTPTAAPAATGALPAQAAPVTSALSNVTTTAGATLTGVGHAAGSVVTGAVGTVSQGVKPISPPLAHVVGQAGNALGRTTDATLGTVGSMLTRASASLSGH